jgi:hypothetical protein
VRTASGFSRSGITEQKQVLLAIQEAPVPEDDPFVVRLKVFPVALLAMEKSIPIHSL